MKKDKVLISDEITEKVVSFKVWYSRRPDETCDYLFVKLEDSTYFYFNRFAFL